MTVIEQAVKAGKSEPVWPVFKPNKLDSVLGKKEMSPEQTLIEFISTSAGLHGVTQISLRSLEWDLLKVFPYNIMPANAAAWYMAKRKYYADQPANQQLLPFILKKYPDKFRLNKFKVEFLETYSKETAKRKLNFLVEFGLDAYFSHKVDEYGVYFFDPGYYERTEPFHEALVLCTKGNRQRFVVNYFNGLKSRYSFVMHAPNLASITKDFNSKVMTKMTGVIVSMINNQYGYIKFGSGEKALFCAKAVFKDGWHFSGDPLRLPAMYFDAYKAPEGAKSGDDACKWYAVLVWCGRKPAPKFYSTLADFNLSPAGFPKTAAAGNNAALAAGDGGDGGGRKLRQPSSSMMIGEVVSIRKNGAVVSDVQGKVFVPGWSKENLQRPGVWLNTLTGDTIGLHDLVAYYIDSTETMDGFRAVGKNVFVLKNSEETGAASKRNSRSSVPLSEGGNYEPLSESDYITENSSESEYESEGEAVSDGELEWLEKDLDDLIGKDGAEAPSYGFLVKLKRNLSEVRATRSKATPTRQRNDSGLGSNPTTPRDNGPLKVGKRSNELSSVFWRTNAALASIEEGYRSSEDEDYGSGDEVESITVSAARKRRHSTYSMSSASTKSRRNKPRASVTDSEAGKTPLLPYWVRAISLPEEYDPDTQKFVPVDKNYNEDNDPDYNLPLTDYDDDDFEEQGSEIKEKEEVEESPNEKEKVIKEEAEKTSGEALPETDVKPEAEIKEDLDEELKLLLKEAEEELDEALLEGKHRQQGEAPVQDTPEKIVVNKPESEGEEVVEEMTFPEPPKKFNWWHPPSYVKFLENLQVDLPDEESGDIEYVPPAVIFDEDCDYDEFDVNEVIPEDEVADLQKELDFIKANVGKNKSSNFDLSSAGNYIPIWVHVDSIEDRKEKAIAEIARKEQLRQEKEAALKAAQEKAEAKAAAAAADSEAPTDEQVDAESEVDAENANKKLSLKGLEGTVKELGTYDPKPQRKHSATKKKTKSQGESDAEEKAEPKTAAAVESSA